MRDVILAAASEAADATLVPARETSGPAEPHDDIAAQLTQVRSAGEAEGIRQGSARGFWSEVQRVYENRICTSLPSSLRIAWNGVLKPRHFLGVRLAVRMMS